MGNYGTNLEGFGGFEGGVNADKGAPLVSTSSDGETALLFGPAALREIQAGVANGDFAIPPDEAGSTITDENPLPYWTGTATGSAPTVSAAVTSSTVTASGAALTFTVAAGAATNSAYTITRYVPIAGNRNRSSAYHPEVHVASVTGGGTDKTRVRLTLTATAVDSDYSPLTVTATANATAITLATGSLFTDWMVPDGKAAYLLVSVKVDVPATAPVDAVTFVISEVRVARSESAIAFPSVVAAGAQPWLIENYNGTFEMYRQGSGADPAIQMDSDASSGVYDITLQANNENGTITLIAGGSAAIEAPFTTITRARLLATNDASLSSTEHAFQIGDSSGQNLRIDSNEIMAVNNGATSTLLLQNDGGLTRAGGGFAVTGNIDATGSIASEDLIQALGVFRTIRASALDLAFTARATADGTPRFAVFCNGAMEWGAGGTRDLNLYRSAAGVLRTDFDLDVGGYLTCDDGATFNALIQGTNISLDGSQGLRHDAPATTSQSSSAAIWVLVSGTNYQLRRNTSSARYKTNIVDADEVVLEASRKVKARHYESTIEDENGATRLGFIAEEIHEAGLTHAVEYDAEGRPDTIDSVALIAALWHRVSDLEDRLKALEEA
jgi:hypothetical protein